MSERKKLRLLILEDSSDDALLLVEALRAGGFEPEHERIDSPAEFSSALDRGGWDLIISDYAMPAFTGIDALKLYRQKYLDIPFILVSGTVGEDTAVEAMKLGAHDYVMKTRLARLAPAVERELREADIRRKRRRAEEALVAYAYRQAVVAELGRQALDANDIGSLMRRGTATVRESLEVDFGTLFEVIPGEQRLLLREGSGWEDTLIGSASVPVSTGSPEGFSVLNNEPVIIGDTTAENRFGIPPLLREHGILSSVTVPIVGKSRVYGALSAESVSPRTFTREQISFLKSVANVLAAAIERHQAEESLRRSELKYRSIFTFAPVGIYQSTPDGRLLHANPRLAQLLAYDSVEELTRANTTDFYFDPRERAAWVGRMEQAAVLAGERRLKRKDGAEVWIEESAHVIRDEAGQILYYEGFVHDVTDRRRAEQRRHEAEEQLQRVNRIDSLGRVAGTMAHEFNNILMGIQPFAEVLERTGDEKTRRSAQQILSSLRRGREMTQEILRFNAPETSVLGAVNLTKLLQNLEAEARNLLRDHTFELCSTENGVLVKGDESRLHQVLLNLLVNARDATPQGGRISVQAEKCDRGQRFSFGNVEQPERFVHIHVRDTGSGMEPRILERIFEPMFTTKKSGTGLGLAFVHQVITRQQGHILVETAINAGTTFHLFLPLMSEEKQP